MFIEMFLWCIGNCVCKHVRMFKSVEVCMYLCINVFS